MFDYHEQKTRTHNTTMNMTTNILIAIYIHMWGYEGVFFKIHIRLGINISE